MFLQATLDIGGRTHVECAGGVLEDADGERHAKNWLPGLVPQFVLRDVFAVRLPSLARLAGKTAARRAKQGRDAMAAQWDGLIKAGAATNRADLARQLGLSRARVTQVLSPANV